MTEPRAIFYVISCLRTGGGERQLVEHLRAIDRKRWRPIIACFERVGEFLPQLVELGIDPIEFPLKGDLERPNSAYQALRMAALIRRERVSVVHGYDFWGNLFAVAAGRLARRPVVVNQLDQGKHLSTLQRKGQAWARRLAHRVAVNAEALRREVLAEGTPPRKVRVLSQGIDLERFDRLAQADPQLPPWNGPTAVTVANMIGPQKGHEDILCAAEQFPHVRFVFCGDGPHRPALERQSNERGLGSRVLFLGKRGDVPAILARSSCVLHPSYAEGLPNAVIEACAASRPVVASAVGGIPELVRDGENGYLIPPRDPAALADRLGRVLGDPGRAMAMGRNGRAHIERNYTLRRMVERHDQMYEELLA